jgi:hypothetical protein
MHTRGVEIGDGDVIQVLTRKEAVITALRTLGRRVGNHQTDVAEQDARPRVAWRHSRGPIARLGIGRHPPRALGYDSLMGQNASGADVVTTTYGYDAFGARVYQSASSTALSATTTYPFKFFPIASSTRASSIGSAAKKIRSIKRFARSPLANFRSDFLRPRRGSSRNHALALRVD